MRGLYFSNFCCIVVYEILSWHNTNSIIVTGALVGGSLCLWKFCRMICPVVLLGIDMEGYAHEWIKPCRDGFCVGVIVIYMSSIKCYFSPMDVFDIFRVKKPYINLP